MHVSGTSSALLGASEKDGVMVARFGFNVVSAEIDANHKIPYWWPAPMRRKFLASSNNESVMAVLDGFPDFFQQQQRATQRSQDLSHLGPPTGNLAFDLSTLPSFLYFHINFVALTDSIKLTNRMTLFRVGQEKCPS